MGTVRYDCTSLERNVIEFNLKDTVLLTSAVIVRVLSTIKEKLHVLHGDNKKDGLQTRPHPLKTPSHENTKTFEKRELKLRRLMNGFHIQNQFHSTMVLQGQHTKVSSCVMQGG